MADFLEDIDPYVCARYLEYIIAERREESAEFHERLAELYLSLTLDAKRRGDESKHLSNGSSCIFNKNIHQSRERPRTPIYFNSSTPLTITDLTGCTAWYPRMVSTLGWLRQSALTFSVLLDLFEARAILLGRLGRHDQALEMYAYRLKDFLKAEE